ncbi:MAG: hypothetical protein U9Q81_24705 [Pseudomonadota bacterium]|nr:hypothetical protein [Pseudomonadota bacterium]
MSEEMTLLPEDRAETEKTAETDVLTNTEFLETVFEGAKDDACPLVVSFEGDPLEAPRKAWSGKPWLGIAHEDASLSPSANNYFSLATFRPDEAGRYRRQKARFHALHAVMLDDLGTKVAMERLTLDPSWLLETSEGNYQAGYLLREPLGDGTTADGLMNAVVAAGLCDPGANGPRARLARLSEAVNGKHAPPFPCRMAAWRPELRYSVAELTDGLQLDMAQPGRPKRDRTGAQPGPTDGEPVWIPRPEENVVLDTLRQRGLYKGPLGGGKHDITCPWLGEHTGGADGGTAYFEPDDQWPIGGFKCLHGHCADRHIRDLLRFLAVEPAAARMKPIIRVVAGEIHRVVDAAERELAQSGRYYQRGGLIVTVLTDPGTRETRVQKSSQPALAGVATWERFDARAEDWVRIDPPARHAGVLFDSSSFAHLPVLNGLARQPYLRTDASLMTAAGYDPDTGMFGVFDARQFAIPDAPSAAEAMAALASLQELLTEFSFASDSDLAAALSAMLTAAVRPSLPHAPMFHARAHTVGSGKSYLCELITTFATPQRAHPGDVQDGHCQHPYLVPLQWKQCGTDPGYDATLPLHPARSSLRDPGSKNLPAPGSGAGGAARTRSLCLCGFDHRARVDRRRKTSVTLQVVGELRRVVRSLPPTAAVAWLR